MSICANCENHYIVEHARHGPLCPFHCMFGNFGSPFGHGQIPQGDLTGHNGSLPRKFDNVKKPFPVLHNVIVGAEFCSVLSLVCAS